MYGTVLTLRQSSATLMRMTGTDGCCACFVSPEKLLPNTFPMDNVAGLLCPMPILLYLAAEQSLILPEVQARKQWHVYSCHQM